MSAFRFLFHNFGLCCINYSDGNGLFLSFSSFRSARFVSNVIAFPRDKRNPTVIIDDFDDVLWITPLDPLVLTEDIQQLEISSF